MEKLVRISLWLTAPANLVVAYAFAFPTSWLGILIALPAHSHTFYTYFSGAMVGLFGLVYIWLALQPVINRPLLTVGAAGKFLAVCITWLLFAAGDLASVLAFVISGDLLFVVLWLYFVSHKPQETNPEP